MSRKFFKLWFYTPDKFCSRVEEMDVENFDRIQKMHPHFPELIAAFKDEPEAYDSFITIVSFFFTEICPYMRIYWY